MLALLAGRGSLHHEGTLLLPNANSRTRTALHQGRSEGAFCFRWFGFNQVHRTPSCVRRRRTWQQTEKGKHGFLSFVIHDEKRGSDQSSGVEVLIGGHRHERGQHRVANATAEWNLLPIKIWRYILTNGSIRQRVAARM